MVPALSVHQSTSFKLCSRPNGCGNDHSSLASKSNIIYELENILDIERSPVYSPPKSRHDIIDYILSLNEPDSHIIRTDSAPCFATYPHFPKLENQTYLLPNLCSPGTVIDDICSSAPLSTCSTTTSYTTTTSVPESDYVHNTTSFRPTINTNDLCHVRPANDSHYPFKLVRKARTRMTSTICVWCAAQTLMSSSNRPKLRKRTLGNDADWEKLIRNLETSSESFWKYLTTQLLPLERVLEHEQDLGRFYRDLSGALVELWLREMKGDSLPKKDLMAQVRSAKSHKVSKISAIIERAYSNFSI